MRNLTIQRNKTFVACAMKMKVYIEDHTFSELTICGVPCRKLGEIKNGEAQTYSIADNAAKVFVIADMLSKEYCNEVYQLPEGNEDVSLSGKNHFNPMAGNPFRFDNNNNTEALENRKKGKHMGTIIMICAIAIGFIIGLAIGFGAL